MDEGYLHPPDAAPPESFGLIWPPPRCEWTGRDEAFILAIREDPTDDTPRLIYADWLTDQNDPRGLFIQLDIAILHEDDPRRLRSLLRDRRRVLQRYEEYWHPGDRVQAIGGFTRGFLEAVTMTSEQVLEHGEVVFAREPIHELRLKLPNLSQVNELTTTPCLGHLQRLRIDYERTGLLRGILNLPNLRRVNALTLSPEFVDAVTDRAAGILAKSSLLSQLRTLRLPGLSATALSVLLNRPGFAVERLEVPGSQRDTGVVPAWDDESSAIVDVPSIDELGLMLLAEHPAARSLRYLDASYNPVSLVLPRILRSPNLANLQTIRVGPRREIDVVAERG